MFTCAGRRVALMEAFRHAMEELAVTGRVIAADVTDASAAFQKADEGVIVPSAGHIEYVPALLSTVRKHNVGLLVPLTDLDIRSLARQRQKFADAGCTVMVGSEDTVMLCRDKARTNACLKAAGLATVRTLPLSDFRREPFYPCFVKPIRGSASVGAGAIHGEKELHAHVATFGELLIVQDYIPGREYTIDVYRSRDGQVRCVVPRQRLTVRSGEIEKGITSKDPQLIDAAVNLAALLGDIWGVFCCQCRRAPGGEPHFFEINPRFGGGVPLSIAAGANLPLYLLQEVLGLPITAKIGEFTDRLLMMRYDEAVFMRIDDPDKLPGFDAPQFR
ncbi:MAG TPA: ATP-grasp domain-containing protein [Phycisphaerae bacterium]|nr:ATP-grasp domain-containing protein [Phycisphaerae bacterium]